MRILSLFVPAPILLFVAAEWALAFSCVYLAFLIRFLGDWEAIQRYSGSTIVQATVFAFVVILSIASMGLYDPRLRTRIEGVIARLLTALALGAAALTLIYFALPGLGLGRGIWGLSLALSLALLSVARLIRTPVGQDKTFRRRVLVYGAGTRASSILQLRRRSDRRGFTIVAFLRALGDECVIEDARVREPRDGLLEIVRQLAVEEVVIAADDRRRELPIDELLDCKFAGINVLELMDFLERESGRVHVELATPSWIIFSEGFTRRHSQQIATRILDVVASAGLLFLTWPLMLAIGLAILVEDGRPVLYRQARVGYMGQPFQLLKFRSMGKDAEPEGMAQWAETSDDRITRVGRIIRKLRLDELPQILNVLKAEMSLVGPRPERPEFVKILAQSIPYYRERHSVKPGLTGWAQLRYPYGASEADALAKLRYDLFYIKNHSLLFDLAILLQTAEVVLFGKGAR